MQVLAAAVVVLPGVSCAAALIQITLLRAPAAQICQNLSNIPSSLGSPHAFSVIAEKSQLCAYLRLCGIHSTAQGKNCEGGAFELT